MRTSLDPAQFPPADQLGVCFEHRPDALVLWMKVVQPLDPATDAAWAASHARLSFIVVPDGEDSWRQHEIRYHVRDGAIQVTVEPTVGRVGEIETCRGTGATRADGYTMTVPWSCLPLDDPFSLRSEIVLTEGNDTYHDMLDEMLFSVPAPPSQPQPPAPSAPSATPGRLTHGARLDGGGSADPIGQVIATSQHLFGDGEASRVVLATAGRFPDALAAAALAGTHGPVLLTPSDSPLDGRVRAEIARVTGGDGIVLVLGGPAAVTEESAATARAAAGDRPCAAPFPPTCRYRGQVREETAALVAETVRAENPQRAGTALLARSDDFADALTGGAYAARTGTAILLTTTTVPHPATVDFLRRHGVTEVIALGGPAAISDATLAAMPVSRRERVSGAERTATASEIARVLWRSAGLGDGGAVVVNVRSADGWQAALSAAVASAVFDAPQIGVETPVAALPPHASALLRTIDGPVQAYGDAGLVSDRQIADAAAASGCLDC